MSLNWSELIQAKPHELVISGKNGTEQISREDGLNELCFKISSLNFLEVSGAGLSKISPLVDKLGLLTNLVLFGNKLTELPTAVGNLTKLKFLDVSRNLLEKIPDELGNCTELQSLIVSDNKLNALPDLSKLDKLIVVKIDQNNFTEFPESLLNADNPKVRLTDIHAQRNQIVSIPGSISRLTALKLIDLRDNALTVIPGDIGDCTKLKDIMLAGNKLADRRLLKLVDQCKAKQIIDYIRANCVKAKSASRGGRETSADRKANAREGRARKRSTSRSSRENSESFMDTIKILSVKDDSWFTVTASPMVMEQRKVVACLVRNVNLGKEGVLKRFLQLQTGLHDGICGKRQLATIAVHDLEKIKGKVTFDVKPPAKLRLVPLNRAKEMTASELYKLLVDEAELLRKEKKRNTFSTVHKYLFLLKGKSRYPCLSDEEGTVISFPPITNSETTRLTPETRNLFIEVTGESTPTCRKVIDALLHGMIKLHLGDTTLWPQLSDVADGKGNIVPRPSLIEVEPVRVIDKEGKLVTMYPSKIDLVFDDVNITRDI